MSNSQNDDLIDDLIAGLDAALIKAHQDNDSARLITLYKKAAEAKEASGDIDAACFYYTHAYVFSLQEGADIAETLRARLMAHGREAPHH